jgi:hypothetical protein
MATRRKTAREKRDLDKAPKRVRLDFDFAGIPAGSMMLVATPRLVDDYLRTIPHGQTRSVERLRRELARRHRCDATCPVSLAIFLRICADAAWEELEAGAEPDAVAPFWRAVEPDSKLAKKLRADSAFIARQREIETGEPGAQAGPKAKAPPPARAPATTRRRSARRGAGAGGDV